MVRWCYREETDRKAPAMHQREGFECLTNSCQSSVLAGTLSVQAPMSAAQAEELSFLLFVLSKS